MLVKCDVQTIPTIRFFRTLALQVTEYLSWTEMRCFFARHLRHPSSSGVTLPLLSVSMSLEAFETNQTDKPKTNYDDR